MKPRKSQVHTSRTAYSNTHYRDQLWHSRGTRCPGGIAFRENTLQGLWLLLWTHEGPQSLCQWREMGTFTSAAPWEGGSKWGIWTGLSQHNKVQRRHLGSGLLWGVLHMSFVCGNYKASKKLIWVLTWAAPQNPRSVLRQQKEQNQNKPLASTEVVTSSMKGLSFHQLWRAFLFHVYLFWWFLSCAGFSHT